MGFQMEKFGAEEMEFKLFLFAVLQICLFSPWSVGRGLLCSVWDMERSWLFYQCLRAWPHGTAMCQEPGGIGTGGSAWPLPVPKSLQSRLLQTHCSL